LEVLKREEILIGVSMKLTKTMKEITFLYLFSSRQLKQGLSSTFLNPVTKNLFQRLSFGTITMMCMEMSLQADAKLS
jgi:hypothetical protein